MPAAMTDNFVDPPFREERMALLNGVESPREDGAYVLYWMQQSQRAENNHALEFAVRQANELGQPCLAVFGLAADYPDANTGRCEAMLPHGSKSYRRRGH